MQRQPFISGMVTGAVVGAILTFAIGARYWPVPEQPKVQCLSVGNQAEPEIDTESPPNSTREFFNGRPFYIVPLAAQNAVEAVVASDETVGR